tara:strand:- start:153 stop:344 length:192 start_codon:yes stop_codon:yes gene_type:complete
MIDFEVSFLANDSGHAMKMLNSKHYIKNAEVCNFMNIPVDNVRVNPNSETLQLMDELGEGYND